MKISIIIPNYNGEELLKKNLPKVQSAIENSKNEVVIIVVDDTSTDTSVSVISNSKFQIPNLRLIKNDKNLGFSSTLTKGGRGAQGKIVVLLITHPYPESRFLPPSFTHFSIPT